MFDSLLKKIREEVQELSFVLAKQLDNEDKVLDELLELGWESGEAFEDETSIKELDLLNMWVLDDDPAKPQGILLSGSEISDAEIEKVNYFFAVNMKDFGKTVFMRTVSSVVQDGRRYVHVGN